MDEYIERQKVFDSLPVVTEDKTISLYGAVSDFIVYVSAIPSADVAPVRHGTWEWFEEWIPSTTEHPAECEDCGWQCGNCKRALEDMVGGYWDDPYERPQLAYCPNCGCRMDGGN